MTEITDAAKNTDRELWREREGDYYANSIHVTERGGIGIKFGGSVIVKPLAEWHALASMHSTSTPLEGQVTEARTRMFLEILSAMGGESDASDGSWVIAFCDEHENRDPLHLDTYNQAINDGLVRWSHDSDMDCTTIRLTDKGRAALSSTTNAVAPDEDAKWARVKARTIREQAKEAADRNWPGIDSGLEQDAERYERIASRLERRDGLVEAVRKSVETADWMLKRKPDTFTCDTIGLLVDGLRAALSQPLSGEG